jgi:phosphate:Na+ symporter
LESAEELKEKSLSFTPTGQKEMDIIVGAIHEIAERTLEAVASENSNAAASVEPLEQVIDELKEQLRTRHILRLQQGNCSIEAGFVWSDLLTNLERCSDHCSNIAGCLLEMNRTDMNLHEALRDFRTGNRDYQENYHSYAEKFSLPRFS